MGLSGAIQACSGSSSSTPGHLWLCGGGGGLAGACSPHSLQSSHSLQGPDLQTECSVCLVVREPLYMAAAGQGGSLRVGAPVPVGAYGGPRMSKWGPSAHPEPGALVLEVWLGQCFCLFTAGAARSITTLSMAHPPSSTGEFAPGSRLSGHAGSG